MKTRYWYEQGGSVSQMGGGLVVEKIEPNLIIDGTVGRKAILHIQRSQWSYGTKLSGKWGRIF